MEEILVWAQHCLAERRRRMGEALPQSSAQTSQLVNLDTLVNRLGDEDRVARFYCQVSANLVAIFKGEVEPLELLVHSGLLEEYYQELATYSCTS